MRMSSQRNATLRIATSQFPVSHDLGRNTKYVLRQMRDAKSAGADVVHFPEGALSGYAGTDFDSFRGFDWSLLRSCSQRVLQRAAELELWVLLGSSHPLSPRHEPHNCVYVIDPAFYGRFGFRAEPGLILPDVPPAYFQALSFGPSLPHGLVAYDVAFDAGR